MAGKQMSAESKAILKELWQKGWPVADIAKTLLISSKSAYMHVHRLMEEAAAKPAPPSPYSREARHYRSNFEPS